QLRKGTGGGLLQTPMRILDQILHSSIKIHRGKGGEFYLCTIAARNAKSFKINLSTTGSIQDHIFGNRSQRIGVHHIYWYLKRGRFPIARSFYRYLADTFIIGHL